MNIFGFKKIFLSLIALSAVSACSIIDKTFNEYENVTRVGEITLPKKDMENSIIKVVKGKFFVDIDGVNFKRYYEASIACNSKSEEDEKKGCRNSRNRIIGQWMYVSDLACAHHLGVILGRANTTSVFLGLASITASGLATFLGGEGTRQALAAASTISTGANSLIKSEIYLGSLTPLLTKKIEDNRNRIGANITSNLNASTAEFPIDEAIVNLSTYHEACSFRKGVQLLADALERTGPTKQEIDEQIQKLQERKTTLIAEIGEYGQKDLTPQILNQLNNSALAELEYIGRRIQVLTGSRPNAPRSSQ